MEVPGFLYPSREHLAWLVDSSTQCLSSPIADGICSRFWASLALGCLLVGLFLLFLAALRWWFDYPNHPHKRLFKLKSGDELLDV